ncbi:putative ATP binding protein [Corchorus olitorius]|uniref:ATP binding protein n=1 Tax=Corchorus olitorius TaxID=93759 RepID=A0A1R3K029_9ROSI|nr:putative ATP binding protein [Corchorus olitorius]
MTSSATSLLFEEIAAQIHEQKLKEAAASVATTAMLFCSFAREVVPHELRDYIFSKIKNFLATFFSELTLVFDEYDGLNF